MDIRRVRKLEQALLPKRSAREITVQNMTYEQRVRRLGELAFMYREFPAEYSHLSKDEFVEVFCNADYHTRILMEGYKNVEEHDAAMEKLMKERNLTENSENQNYDKLRGSAYR